MDSGQSMIDSVGLVCLELAHSKERSDLHLASGRKSLSPWNVLPEKSVFVMLGSWMVEANKVTCGGGGGEGIWAMQNHFDLQKVTFMDSCESPVSLSPLPNPEMNTFLLPLFSMSLCLGLNEVALLSVGPRMTMLQNFFSFGVRGSWSCHFED